MTAHSLHKVGIHLSSCLKTLHLILIDWLIILLPPPLASQVLHYRLFPSRSDTHDPRRYSVFSPHQASSSTITTQYSAPPRPCPDKRRAPITLPFYSTVLVVRSSLVSPLISFTPYASPDSRIVIGVILFLLSRFSGRFIILCILYSPLVFMIP